MAVVLGGIIIVFGLLGIYGVFSYAFSSYGIYKIAKREEKAYAFLSWIPYLNKIVMGKISFGSYIQGFLMSIIGIISVIALTLTLFIKIDNIQLLYTLTTISFVLSTISKIFDFVAHYKIYNKYSGSVVLMTILDIISLGILGPIFIFAIRNNDIKQRF